MIFGDDFWGHFKKSSLSEEHFWGHFQKVGFWREFKKVIFKEYLKASSSQLEYILFLSSLPSFL